MSSGNAGPFRVDAAWTEACRRASTDLAALSVGWLLPKCSGRWSRIWSPSSTVPVPAATGVYRSEHILGAASSMQERVEFARLSVLGDLVPLGRSWDTPGWEDLTPMGGPMPRGGLERRRSVRPSHPDIACYRLLWAGYHQALPRSSSTSQNWPQQTATQFPGTAPS
jgi:hypothetical protein